MHERESLVIPTYSKLGRRKSIKEGQTEHPMDAAYTNIRRKISTSTIQVPYKKGLAPLVSLHNLNGNGTTLGDDSANVTASQAARKYSLDKTIESGRKSILSDTENTKNNEEMQEKKVKFQKAKFSNLTKASTTNVLSNKTNTYTLPPLSMNYSNRPTSYSSSYGTESLWSDRLEEIKSRYSENSEFLSSLSKLEESSILEKNRTTLKENNLFGDDSYSNKKSPSQSPRKSRNARMSDSSVQSGDEESENKGRKSSFSDLRITPEFSTDNRGRKSSLSESRASEYSIDINKGRKTSFSESRMSEYSLNSRPSMDAFNQAKLPPVSSRSENSDSSKVRKVEFNLPRTSSLRLPELPSQPTFHTPSAMGSPKSILKRNHLSALPITWSPQYAMENEQPTTSSGWQPYLPVVQQSPPPFEKDRTKQNLLFKCSKEFEKVAIDIDIQDYIS